jgi:CubicO group peptidase (beta-lactamase class C family)
MAEAAHGPAPLIHAWRLVRATPGSDCGFGFLPASAMLQPNMTLRLCHTLNTKLLSVLLVAIFCVLRQPTAAADDTAAKGAAATNSCPTTGDVAITSLLRPIREKYDLPAMAAVVVTSDRVLACGAVGVRKRGTNVAVTLDDLWHLGSETKAMTAVLMAKLVERGALRWDSTMAAVFPELESEFAPTMRGLTPVHLLSHRAGLPANLTSSQYGGPDASALRLRAVQETLAKAPANPPGSNYLYSNLGYILAGAMAEKVTGRPWEQAMREEVFTPLKLASAGYGGTGTHGQVDQPWPHRKDGKPTSSNGPDVDNPPVLGPAGRVHATMHDWAKFIQDQLRGAQGKAGLLSPASYQRLHDPPFGGDYALGWLVVERPWGGGKVLHHTGDNTMNHASAWLAPRRDFALLICANQGGDTAAKACDAAASALIVWQQQASRDVDKAR